MELEKQKEEHIFKSKLPDIHIPNHLPTHTYCFQNLSNHHSRPAIIDPATGRFFTHADVELISRRVAAGLHALGICKGHVIMLLLHNSPEFVFSFLAASTLGATTTTANPLFTASEIKKQADISQPQLIITHSAYVEKVEVEQSNAKIVTINSPHQNAHILHFSQLMNSDEKTMPQVEVNANDMAVLPFSSGTTGLPKAVMLSHKNLVTCVSQQVDGENPCVYLHSDDVMLCVLPLFHVFSMISVMLCSLRVGAAIVIMQKFDVKEMMRVVEKYRVTIASVVPPIMLAIAKSAAGEKYDLSSVRRVVCGAAPIDEKLVGLVKAKLPNAVIGQGYGMTEAGVLSMCLGFAKIPYKFKPGSCGTVIRNARMKIVDPSTGASLPRNQTGEICVKGDEVMKGYLNDPEATGSTIDGDGWLHSGDLGYVDDEDELYVVERLKELIKYKGFHVAPAELESLLIAHPSISDAAVVPLRDENAGEAPVAFVVRANGSRISEQEIIQYIADQVVSYKRIHRVFFTSGIPKAPSGKILRKNLRARI